MSSMFLSEYHRLNGEGACDGVGGMECRRVYQEWLDAGQPDNVEQFIRMRANNRDFDTIQPRTLSDALYVD